MGQMRERLCAQGESDNGSRRSDSMRKLLLATALAGMLATNVGCLIPLYSADPARRAQQLIFTSEDLRTILDEWERIWFLDQPSHMKPFRTHGGII
jgi:hypothetical protein